MAIHLLLGTLGFFLYVAASYAEEIGPITGFSVFAVLSLAVITTLFRRMKPRFLNAAGSRSGGST